MTQDSSPKIRVNETVPPGSIDTFVLFHSLLLQRVLPFIYQRSALLEFRIWPWTPHYSLFTHFLNLSHTLQKGWSFSLMLLCDWPFSKSIRTWRSLSNSDRAPEAQRLAVEQERVSAPCQEAPTFCSFLLEKTRIFQLIHGEISFLRRPETYPFRTAALTTTGDEKIRSSQRLEFTEDFHSSFVLGGARVPVSSSPWAPFRAFWWQLTLVRFPKTRRPDLSPCCPVHRVFLSVPGRLHTHPGAASLLTESPATTQLTYLPGRASYPHSSNSPSVFRTTKNSGS